MPLVVAYGGGLNSTAMLVGFRDRGIRPDLILFADTGGERPETYAHVQTVSAFTKLWWGVEIETVRKLYQGRHEGLEGECRRKGVLPSLAYGRKACSMKHKVQPQQRRVREWMRAHDCLRVRQAVGYDAGEGHRSIRRQEEALGAGRVAQLWFPLIEWQWRREDCARAVAAAGLPVPGKSACFFCPASKRSEVFRLRDEAPELLERALAMEDAAQRTVRTKRGLGGQGNLWRNWLAMDAAQPWLDIEPVHVPCGCVD